ncbi:MAG: phenylacetic acid degradation bifunctional protein PaaZ [Gammaproteobacteria bacterium]|nr:phenylacetic acid degradation bifunctional protein PaaZ [Gammaproteobacteria bacterium]
MRLHSYIQGCWKAGRGRPVPLLSAVDGRLVAEVSSEGFDFSEVAAFGRQVGGPALRELTFHQRALLLKSLAQHLLEHKEEFYRLSRETGATRDDSWIDIEGGIATLFAYSGKGRRELPNSHVYVDGEPEPLSKNGTFVGQHIYTPMTGVAVHINAFNFPCWGMLEKLAPSFIAGMPCIVKPASQTAYLTELMARRILESGILPKGSLQLICGSIGDLLDHLSAQDAVTFTGSSGTGLMLRRHPALLRHSIRFTMEADSLNASVLGPDAQPGTPEFDLYIAEVVREMTVKCGQKCTAIRRALVPRAFVQPVIEALEARLRNLVIGDPWIPGVSMGALASRAQCSEVRERVNRIAQGARIVYDGAATQLPEGPLARQGAFFAPVVLYCDSPFENSQVHDIEAFGPVTTIVPYDDGAQAIELANRGQGSLVGSIFTGDDEFSRQLVLGIGAWHGRVLIVNRDCAAESTGHGSPLPGLIHGGPGRAGGGEEMGGIRGVLHYMQRNALQGSPTTLSRITGKWIRGAEPLTKPGHPFRKRLGELEVGESILTGKRQLTLADIEHFAKLSGDRFYAHMDEAAARANPFFEGRVAHGYFIVSAAAGLFVDPAPGPVLANYGLENLRFLAPVAPGDEIQVRFTCKQITPRETEDYGEVRWDCQVFNQAGVLVATYDVLTLVAKH